MILNNFNQLKGLITIPVYFTTKSKRQTTPNLFQNPKLTKFGIIQRIPKSYAYNLPQNLHNRHLYWDRTVQNKARRVKLSQLRRQKLQIKPIHQNGKRTFDRSIQQILHQVSNLKLVRASLGRTFTNLTEVLIRFKNDISAEDRQIVINTINDIHQRFLPSLSLYQFSSYCQIRCMAQLECTQDIFVHFYKYVQQFSQMTQNGESDIKKFDFKVFLKLLKYVFTNKNASYLKNNHQMLYKNRQVFKLFEDNDPRFISFQELMPFVYNRQEVAQQLNDESVKKNLKYLNYLPGGKALLQKLTA